MKRLNSSGLQSAKRALGRRIRELRETKGWSQAEFASMCGVGASYLQGIERGETDPRCSVLRNIATTLGISIFSLLEPVA
jgi:transcriptional regulator with XRE-family HTH domain